MPSSWPCHWFSIARWIRFAYLTQVLAKKKYVIEIQQIKRGGGQSLSCMLRQTRRPGLHNILRTIPIPRRLLIRDQSLEASEKGRRLSHYRVGDARSDRHEKNRSDGTIWMKGYQAELPLQLFSVPLRVLCSALCFIFACNQLPIQ